MNDGKSNTNVHPAAVVANTERIGSRVTVCRKARISSWAQLDGRMTVGEGAFVGADVILINAGNVAPNASVPCPAFVEALTRHVCMYSWVR